MNKKFDRIIIGIAIIAFAITPVVYSLDIRVLWAVILDLGSSSIAAIASVLIAFLSVLIAGFSLWLSRQADKRNEKQARLLVKPFLAFEIYHHESDDPICKGIKGFYHYKFQLSNYGVGPALIKKFVLLSDEGKKSHVSPESYNDILSDMMAIFPYSNINNVSDSGIIISKEKRALWELIYDAHNPAHCKKFNEIRKLWMEVEYQSIYEDTTISLNFKEQLQPQSTGRPIPPELLPKVTKMAEIYAACFTTRRPWTAEEFADMLKRPNTKELCLTTRTDPNDDSSIIGFAFGEWLDDTKTQFELYRIATIPHEQSRKFGNETLKELIAGVARQSGQSIFLKVAENNAPALHLFEKAGFKRIGLRPAYYKAPNAPNIDAILMRLDI